MTSPSSEGPTAPIAPAGEQAGLFDDFMEIFYSPATVFARREKGGYGMQLLIVSVVGAIFAYVNRGITAQIFDVEWQRGIAKAMAANPNIPADAMNSMRGIQEKIVTGLGYIGTPIGIFVIAFFTWLGAKIFSAKITYAQAATIVTLAWIPRLVNNLVVTIQVLLMDTTSVNSMYSLSLSGARFLDADATNTRLFNLVGSFELFSIWYTILVGIGIAVVAKVPRSKGYLVAGTLFVLGTGFMMLRS